MLTARPPSLPGAGGPGDAAGALRRASTGSSWPTSATATTWRARCWLLGALAGVEVTVASPPELALGRGAADAATPDRGRAARRARRLHRRLGEHGRRGGRRAPARAARAPTASTRSCSPARGNGAVAMHCLPAHPGEEISEGVLYGERSAGRGTRRRTACTRRRRLLELLGRWLGPLRMKKWLAAARLLSCSRPCGRLRERRRGGPGGRRRLRGRPRPSTGGGAEAEAARQGAHEGHPVRPEAVISVETGGAVTWTNDDTVGHDVTKKGGPGADFKSGEPGGMQGGDTFEQTFATRRQDQLRLHRAPEHDRHGHRQVAGLRVSPVMGDG